MQSLTHNLSHPINSIGTLEEFVDENHAIVSGNMGPEYYVCIYSFVDKDQLEPNSSILLHSKSKIAKQLQSLYRIGYQFFSTLWRRARERGKSERIK